MTDGGAAIQREQRRRQRRARRGGERLRSAGLLLSVVGSGCLVIGAALAWVRFTVLGVEVSVPGAAGWGAVTAVIGLLMLLRARRWPLVAAVLGMTALGIGMTAQNTVGPTVRKRILDLKIALAPVNARLEQVSLPPIEPFGAVGPGRTYTGPGPLWTVWGGVALALGGAMIFAGGRVRRTCARCAVLWPESRLGDITFCPSCGFEVGPPTGCSNCGGPLAPGDRFCVRCGCEAVGPPPGT